MRELTRQRCKKGTLRRALLEAMFEAERLGVHGAAPYNATFGMCAAVSRAVRLNSGKEWLDIQPIVYHIFELWPKYSGFANSYPVPGPNRQAADDAYREASKDSMWFSGQYAEDRRELCRWVASELRVILEQSYPIKQ